MRHIGFVVLTFCVMGGSSLVYASDKYTVSLVSVVANRTPWKENHGGLKVRINDVQQPNKNPMRGDEKNLWTFEQSKKRTVDLTCLKARPLGNSFSVQLDAVHQNENKQVGKVVATLVEEDGEVRLAFEMKHGERVRRLRRRQRTGDDTLWLTRVFPVDGSANYILRFKIERTQSHQHEVHSATKPVPK